jgi:hypothetical protein
MPKVQLDISKVPSLDCMSLSKFKMNSGPFNDLSDKIAFRSSCHSLTERKFRAILLV